LLRQAVRFTDTTTTIAKAMSEHFTGHEKARVVQQLPRRVTIFSPGRHRTARLPAMQ
jgi:hypothetical protein